MQPTDRELMLAAGKGDIEKFGIPFDRYHQRLFEFFYRLSGDASSSEDLVQDVFLRMLRYRRSFRETSEFRAWMYQIARTARIDRFKKRWGTDAGMSEQRAAVEPRHAAMPDQSFEREEEAALLHRALLELPEAKREILVLARFQELKYEQIASLLDLDVGAVYECPPCLTYRHQGTVARLLEKYPDTIRYEFRHFPLPIHPNAVQAAVVAEAAGLQGKFWEMHNALLDSHRKWARSADAKSVFVELAGQVGVNVEAFRLAMDSAEIQQFVVQQQAVGKAVGIAGTPTFLLNGKKLEPTPRSFEEFDAVITELLKAMKL